MRYFFHGNESKVICVSHYAGKAVKGIAKCNEEFDKFDPELGMKLAQLRCDAKIAEKRLNRSVKKLAEAQSDVDAAAKNLARMQSYHEDSMNEYNKLTVELNNLLNTLSGK